MSVTWKKKIKITYNYSTLTTVLPQSLNRNEYQDYFLGVKVAVV